MQKCHDNIGLLTHGRVIEDIEPKIQKSTDYPFVESNSDSLSFSRTFPFVWFILGAILHSLWHKEYGYTYIRFKVKSRW